MHTLAVLAIVSLFAAGAALARAEDEPPPTTTTTDATTTTVPTVVPEGSYGWELVRPQAGRRPKPAAPAATPVVTPTTPTPTVGTTPASTPGRAHRAKPRPVRPHRAGRTVRVVKPRRTGAVLAARTTAERATYASLLILAALSLAIACFTVGATPAARVRWTAAAHFVAYRSTQATIVGAVCLAAALLLVLTSTR